jgi:hypothetical protein
MNICVLLIISHMRFEVLTTVLLKIGVLWDVTLCQMVNSYLCFEGL